MKKAIFTIPVWALSYLVNGDKSGLTLDGLRITQQFLRQNRILGWEDSKREEFFSGWNDIGGLACDCVKAVFSVRYTSDELFAKIVYKVDASRGAPVGRTSALYPLKDGGFSDLEKDPVNWDTCPHFDRLVTLDAGGYDRGGAYWGTGAPLRVKLSKDGQFWEFYRTDDKI